MKKSYFLSLFLIPLLAASSLIFFYTALKQLHYYFSLQNTTHPIKLEWKVIEKGSNRYLVEAFFSYKVDENIYREYTLFANTRYKNPWAAEIAIEQLSKKPWDIWYAKNNPNCATLEKKFPLKACLSSFILLTLIGYICCFGKIIQKRV